MPHARLCLLALTFVFLLLVVNLTLQAQTAPLQDRVLVVYNSDVRESKQVADYYLSKRAIPESHLCKISTSSPEAIEQKEFDSKVKLPVQKCLERLGKDTILYVVFSFQTPFLLQVGEQFHTVDQFVADIWDEYLPERAASPAEVQPYFGGAQREGGVYQPYVPLADYRRRPGARTIYSVWRLDAPNAALAKGLVDKALYAEANGLTGAGCFDRNRGDIANVADFGYGAGDWEIHRAADFARQAGFTVTEDDHEQEFGTAPAALRCEHAALYAGWYALDHYNDAFSWNPGAIGIHLDSASVRNPRSGANWAANAVAHGITVTAGAATEPYLENLPRPDQAFFYLFQGANVGDALLRSERLLKWNLLNIGDPLYRPFLNRPALSAQVTPPIMFALLPPATLGDTASSGGIALSKAPSEDLNFSITVDNGAPVTVPATVTIPAGQGGVKFPIEAHAVSVDGATVRIRAKAKGYEVSNTLVLFSLFAGFGVTPEKVKGGSPVMGTVGLRRAGNGTTELTLKSSNPAVAKVPATLSIPAGQDKLTFPVTTGSVSSETSVEISAAYEGLVRSVTLKIVP
jgi:uncharacterized protein (TIGR03790 family)